jgi:hypothetical protein
MTTVSTYSSSNGAACEAELRREGLEKIEGASPCSTLLEIRAMSRLGTRERPNAELPVLQGPVGAFRAVTHQ